MTWGAPIHGSTLESGAVTRTRTWYFAEGATNAFSLFYLVLNPNARFSVIVESLAPDVLFTVEAAECQSGARFLDSGGAALATAIF